MPLVLEAQNMISKLDEQDIQSVLSYMKYLYYAKQTAQENLDKTKIIIDDSQADKNEVEKINAVYEKIPKEEQLLTCGAGLEAIREALKNDVW